MSNSTELIAVVKKICDQLRTKMEVTEYRDYIIGFLFYKYLSEISEKNYNSFKEGRLNGLEYQLFDENHQQYKDIKEMIFDESSGFFIEYKYTFKHIIELIKQGKEIIPALEDAFNKIESINQNLEDKNRQYFKGLFENIDFGSKNLGEIFEDRENTIKFIINEINLLQLKMDENDHLGNAYEHLLAEFASDSGKKAGEFYTPSSVSELLANIVTYKKKRIKAYDPACGSGSLLIKLTKKINKVEKLCGQEIKTATYNLARMNFILRDMNFSKLSIKQGDTLLNPMHLDEENTFNCIVANPPFSLKWNPSKSLKTNDERFIPFPALAPNSYADFAFLQHMLYHVDPNDGIIASVFSLGVLNRQSPKAEKEIRKYIINKNYIDTIIFLPENLFYNTSIKTCIIIARKNKESQDKSIFMINAVNEFQSSKRQNILSKENIEKIFNVWKDKQEIENFSVKVSYEDIVSNDYSLSMNLYNLNDEIEEQEEIDIEFVESELKRLNKEINEQENLFQENLKKYLKNIN